MTKRNRPRTTPYSRTPSHPSIVVKPPCAVANAGLAERDGHRDGGDSLTAQVCAVVALTSALEAQHTAAQSTITALEKVRLGVCACTGTSLHRVEGEWSFDSHAPLHYRLGRAEARHVLCAPEPSGVLY